MHNTRQGYLRSFQGLLSSNPGRQLFCFNGHIVNGLTQRDPGLDLVDVRDVGLAAAPDPIHAGENELTPIPTGLRFRLHPENCATAYSSRP